VIGEEVQSKQPGRSAPADHRPRAAALRRRLTPYLLLAPALLVVGAVLVYPMLDTIRRSFFDWPFGLPGELEFVGFSNYESLLFGSSGFVPSLIFTSVFVAVTIAVEFALAFGVALTLDRLRRGRSVVAAIAIAPYMVAPVAVGLVWRLILMRDAGLLNYILRFLGISPVSWLAHTAEASASVMLAEVWRSMPFVMLILLGALTAIPDSVLEAARTDGARESQVFRYIVRPLLMPAVAVALIFETIFKLRVFDLIVTLTGGGPGTDTTPLGLFIHRLFFRYFEGGLASATSVVLLVMGGVITLVYMKYVYREVQL